MKNLPRRSKTAQHFFQLALIFSFVLLGTTSSWAIVVTTLADSGPGSLREAITTANGDGVATTITFGSPGIILLATPLPNLNGAGDTIDGTGSGVILDGSALAPGSLGLRVRRSNYTIRGLTIQNMPSDGIRIDTPTPPTTILTVTGVVIDSNTLIGNGSRGIRVSGGVGPDKTVDATLINNKISDSGAAGIAVNGNLNQTEDPGGNTVTALVHGNTVKRSRAALIGLPNFGGDGIDIVGGQGDGSKNSVRATVSNNIIFGNRDDGIVAVGCGLLDTGKENFVDVRIINNDVKNNPCRDGSRFCLTPELQTNTGIVVSGDSREVAIGGGEQSSACRDNIIRFEISDNIVTGNRSQNIRVTGGTGTGHNLQGIVSGNSAKDSPEGDGISISAGRGTGTLLHNITVFANHVTGNFNNGISITGGTNSVNAVVDGIDVISNDVRFNGNHGILVSGGTLSENATIRDILINGNASHDNGARGVIITQGTTLSAFPPTIALAGITSNATNRNIDDGIFISSNIPGSGVTPVSQNRADTNGVDGIDINSTGYAVSNNTASKNAVDGINAVGNVNGGGNVAKNNGSCNTPLPASCL